MRRFVHRENIKHYTALLARTTNIAERGRILNLLAEEVAKDLDKPSDPNVLDTERNSKQ